MRLGDKVDIFIGNAQIGEGKISGFPSGSVTVETTYPGASITFPITRFTPNGKGGWKIVIAR